MSFKDIMEKFMAYSLIIVSIRHSKSRISKTRFVILNVWSILPFTIKSEKVRPRDQSEQFNIKTVPYGTSSETFFAKFPRLESLELKI
jgi:hypothetical protein